MLNSKVENLKSELRSTNKELYDLIQKFHILALRDGYSLKLADDLLLDILTSKGQSFYRRIVWVSEEVRKSMPSKGPIDDLDNYTAWIAQQVLDSVAQKDLAALADCYWK